MVNGVGRVQKLGKYNRQWSVVKNRPLNTTLPISNINDKYNENIYVGSKEPINTETFSIPSNDEKDTFCLFLACFLCLVVDNNRIFEPLSPLHVGIIISDLFGGVYGTELYHSKLVLIMILHNWEWGNGGKYEKWKRTLKRLAVLKPVWSLYIYTVTKKYIPQFRIKSRVSKLFPMPTSIHNLQAVKPLYGFISEYCYIFCWDIIL